MISRPASRPYICLNCQRRLARQYTSPSTRASLQSTDPNTRESDSHTANGKDGQQVRRTLVPLSRYRRSDQSRPPSFLAYRPVEEKLGDTFGFRGHSFYKERQALGAKSLGDPAQVIILRESKVHRFDDRSRCHDSPEAKHIDILAQVKDERGLIDKEEVEKNINEFRPAKDQEPKNKDEFNKLVARLQTAFTGPQLETYIDSFKVQSPPKDVSAKIEPTLPTDARILESGPWIFESGDIEDKNSRGSLRGYALPSHTAKQRTVIELLRDCWKLEIPEFALSMGSKEIQIYPTDVKLLSRHMLFASLKEDLLPRASENIVADPLTGKIRITSTQAKCEMIVSQIDKVLDNIQRLSVSLTSLLPPLEKKRSKRALELEIDRHFDDASLIELARLTNTEITRVPERRGSNRIPRRKLIISCLTSPKDAWLSNRALLVRRLLATYSNFSNRQIHRLGCKMPEASTSNEPVFAPMSPTEELPWRDRLRSWFRWSIPLDKQGVNPTDCEAIPRDSDGQEEIVAPAEFPGGTHEEKVRAIFAEQDTPKPVIRKDAYTIDNPKADNWWNHELGTVSSALVGTIGHCHLVPLDLAGSPFDSNKLIRTFSTALPNLSKVLGDFERNTATRRADSKWESVVIHFQPNPFCKDPTTNKNIGAGVLSAFPPLEMHFYVHSVTKALTLSSIRAVVREEGTDLMLPESAVDVRFTQKTTSRLKNKFLDSQPVRDFLGASDLTYENRRLDLPPTLTVPIARHLCSIPDFKKIQGLSPKQEVYDVEYLFVGREARRAMQFEFRNWKLVYTHIDGGRTGGRRNELRLRPIPIKGKGTQKEFVSAVHDLAQMFGTEKAIVARYGIKDKLVRRLVQYAEQEDRPADQKTFTYAAKRPLRLMDDVLDSGQWWDHAQDSYEEDIDLEESGSSDRVEQDVSQSQEQLDGRTTASGLETKNESASQLQEQAVNMDMPFTAKPGDHTSEFQQDIKDQQVPEKKSE